MMQRDLKRIYQRYGIRPFAVPLVAVLGLAVLFDQYAADYSEHLDEATRVSQAQALVTTRLERRRHVEQLQVERKAAFEQAAGRVFVAGDAPQALGELQSRVKSLLERLYAREVSVVPSGALPEQSAGVIEVEARFNGVPQQLPRLQQQLAAEDKMLKLVGIALDVAPEGPVGDHLLVRLRIAAWYTQQDLRPGVGARTSVR